MRGVFEQLGSVTAIRNARFKLHPPHFTHSSFLDCSVTKRS